MRAPLRSSPCGTPCSWSSRSCSGGLLGERAEGRPGRLELPVRERETRLEPGCERLARDLVPDQEPQQHVDARIRARRGHVAAELLRLHGEADALESIRRVRLQPELGDPELQALARESLVQALDEPRE